MSYRYPVIILSLILGVFLIIHSLAAGVVDVADGDEESTRATWGLLMALLWLIGAAFVVPVPLVAVGAFGVAALLGVGVAFQLSSFWFWVAISLGLALMSWRVHTEDVE